MMLLELTELIAILMLVVTTLYLFVTCWLGYSAYKGNQIARKSEEDRIRPYIYCEFFFKQDHKLHFAVVNDGITRAKNVQLKIEPPLRYLSGSDKGKDVAFFANPISSVPPNRRFDTLLGDFSAFKKENPSCKVTCDLSYESVDGKKYYDTIVLDMSYAESRLVIDGDITH
jgi:hypothetical protein